MLADVANGYLKKIDAVPVPMPMREVNRFFFEFLANSEPYVEQNIINTFLTRVHRMYRHG